MTGTLAATLIDRAFQERLGALLEERAPRIDAAELAAQSTVRLLVTEGLLPTVERASPRVPAPFDLLRAGELLATVAWFDLASAFSLWARAYHAGCVYGQVMGTSASGRTGEPVAPTNWSGVQTKVKQRTPNAASSSSARFSMMGMPCWTRKITCPGKSQPSSSSTRRGRSHVIVSQPTTLGRWSASQRDASGAMPGASR
jgi:hypothetical protein